MVEKVTIMLLKVDLQCSRCYKKVKKILCKFPQIRDQVYDEKNNIVIIKVFCCNPERIRDELCCKGCGVIKSIEIRGPDPPKPPQPKPEPPKPEPPKPEPPKPEPEPPKPEPEPPKPEPEPEPPKPEPEPEPAPPAPDPAPVVDPSPPPPPPVAEHPRRIYCCGQCYAGEHGGPCYSRPPPPPPVAEHPPRGYCCGQCYAGEHGGPCYYGYGNGYGYGYARPAPPPPPAYDPCNYYGYNKGYCVSRCGECISDESATACTIM
ncbi:hypothetical protein AKJ16_DCAP24783 [Drosera capensis]